MKMNDMVMISVDDHISEPPDMFKKHLKGDALATAPTSPTGTARRPGRTPGISPAESTTSRRASATTRRPPSVRRRRRSSRRSRTERRTNRTIVR